MGFQDSWWTIFMSSLVILAASVFYDIAWKSRQTDRQTDRHTHASAVLNSRLKQIDAFGLNKWFVNGMNRWRKKK